MAEYYKGSNTRECYRIEYPSKDRPVLKTEEAEYTLLNISEKGAKLIDLKERPAKIGQEIRGAVALNCGITERVVGEVIRLFDKPEPEFIIVFKTRLSFKSVISEQRFLIEKYKHARF